MSHFKDLALRALHTFWQTFTVIFAGFYVASGANVNDIVDVDSGKRFLLALLGAVAGAALSAIKTTAKTLAGSVRRADDPALVKQIYDVLDADDSHLSAPTTQLGAAVHAEPPPATT